jgi:vitamin B12 transporter
MSLQVPTRRAAAIAVAATLGAGTTAAGAQQYNESVVVSAARFEQRLDDTFPHTTLITRNDIERAQAPDVLTLLQRLAGVEIARLGGVGTSSAILLRGGESRQALVLVDGVPINNLNFSLASLEHIVVGQVERIEVVRGNVSSLYGSHAVGGVIQVFTRDGSGAAGAPFSGSARATGGSRGTRDLQGGVAGQAGGWRYAASLSDFATDGFNVLDQRKRAGTNPDRDGYDNRSASARVAFAPAAGHELGASAQHARGRVQYDSEFGPATQADESEQTIETARVYTRNRLAERWTSTLTVARSRDALDARVTAFPFFVTSRGESFVWQNDVRVDEHWTAVAAAERMKQKIDSDTTYARTDRTVDALRAGLVGRAGAHGLQFNVRHDDTSDFGDADTYYAAYRYALGDAWRLHASASSAFNAPTFNDLFFPFGGNPDLRPEKARSNELGLSYSAQALRLRAALFRTRYRDLVGNDAAFNRVNIGRASNEGAELTLETFVATVRVVASATVQDPRDDVADRRLVRRARAFGNLMLTRAFGPLGAELNLRATGDRADVFGGQARTLGGYALVDLALRWRLHPQLAALARVENAFDRSYENAYGYRGTPRGVFAGIEARL